MCDISLLNDSNNCFLTAYERPLFNKSFLSFGLQAYKDNLGNIRVIMPNICAVLLERTGKSYTVSHIFTVESERRKGYARQLLAACSIALKCLIRHSDNLTSDGQAFKKGGLK